MQTLSLSVVRNRLSELVEAAETTLEQITITKNGSPAAILISFAEWESLQETLFWLSQPGILEDLAESDREIAEGNVFTLDEIKVELAAKRSASDPDPAE